MNIPQGVRHLAFLPFVLFYMVYCVNLNLVGFYVEDNDNKNGSFLLPSASLDDTTSIRRNQALFCPVQFLLILGILNYLIFLPMLYLGTKSHSPLSLKDIIFI